MFVRLVPLPRRHLQAVKHRPIWHMSIATWAKTIVRLKAEAKLSGGAVLAVEVHIMLHIRSEGPAQRRQENRAGKDDVPRLDLAGGILSDWRNRDFDKTCEPTELETNVIRTVVLYGIVPRTGGVHPDFDIRVSTSYYNPRPGRAVPHFWPRLLEII